MATVVYTKIGQTRGRKRIWLEGKKLEREGIQPGMKYESPRVYRRQFYLSQATLLDSVC